MAPQILRYERGDQGILDTDWFYTTPGLTTPQPRNAMEQVGPPTLYRIWATRGDNSGSVRIDESPLPLTSPGWNARGNSLAYGKIAKAVDGTLEFQIIVQDGLESRRLLVRQPLDEFKKEFEHLPNLAPAWSPDGRYLAIPHVQPHGLAIVRTDNGHLVKMIDEAYLPSWSPDGSRLAYIKTGNPESLYCLDAGFGSPRLLTDVRGIGQAPTWSRDGQQILTIRGMELPGDGQPRVKATLVRVNADSGQFELIRNLENNRFGADPILSEVSAVLDRDGENLFFTASNSGLNTIIIWIQTRTNSVRNQFNPLHVSVPIGAMAIQPLGEQIALRLGTGIETGPIALMDPQTTKLTPITPDLASRLDWIRMLVTLSRHLIATHQAEAIMKLALPARPTSLPLPGDAAPNSELANKLRAIGTMGGPVCNAEGDQTLDEETKRILTRARLYFAYLRNDFATATTALEEMESTVVTRDLRLRLMGLRAQIDIAKGDVASARPTVEYLQTILRPKIFRYESTLTGPVLTIEERGQTDWPKGLASRLATANLPPLEEEDKTDHTNFDAPQPGLGLDPPPQDFTPKRGRRFNRALPDAPFKEQ